MAFIGASCLDDCLLVPAEYRIWQADFLSRGMMDNSIWLLLALAVLFYLWRRRSLISAEDATSLMAEGANLVDVRSADEYRGDHLDRSINLPLDQIEAQAGTKLPDQQRPVLLYCLSGTRSAMAARTLKRLGYEQVHNLGSISRARKTLG